MPVQKTIKYVIRTKKQIVDAMLIGNIILPENISSKPEFRNADPNEPLGFKLVEGSDFKVVDFYTIKDNPSNFRKVFFGTD